jgi:AraC-like DNA-binding protein
MVHWLVNFRTFRPLATIPRLLVAAGERQTDPAYHHEGRFRQSEPHCLFKYNIAGAGVFRDDAGEHEITPGRGFLCEIRDPATAYYYPPDGRQAWEFVYLCFGGRTATAMVRELVQRYGPVYELPREGGIVSRMLAWESHTGTRPSLSPVEGGRLVLELLTGLAESAQRPEPRGPRPLLAIRVQELIRDNLDRNLSVSDLASMAGVSREHLTRVFREQTSLSPYQYLLRQKMLLACRLLKETSLTHKEISGRLGYGAPAHFSRTFRKVLRMTPGRFRQVGSIPWE